MELDKFGCDMRLRGLNILEPNAWKAGHLILSTYAGSQSSLGEIPKRPHGFNMNGKPVDIELNSYALDKIPTKDVYQYDIEIGDGAEKRGFMKTLWDSSEVKQVRSQGGFDDWIWDGNKLAWSTKKLSGVATIAVDPAIAKNQPDRAGREVKHVRIALAKKVDFTNLHAWLGKQADWDIKVLESLTFLDHLMREGPSRRMISAKRNFFPPYWRPASESKVPLTGRISLGKGVEAVKGVYASIRPVLTADLRAHLAVNVDVANTCFFEASEVIPLLGSMLGAKNVDWLIDDFVRNREKWPESRFYKATKRLNKLTITTDMRSNCTRRYIVKRFIASTPDLKTFELKDGTSMTVKQYYRKAYNAHVRELPLIETTRGQFIALEFAKVEPNQRYLYKLDEAQVGSMMRFAATLPNQRFGSIREGIKSLDWQNDSHLRQYGLHISDQPTVTKGRLLEAPDVHFGNGKILGSSAGQGRWRIDGKKFLKPYPGQIPYGVMVFGPDSDPKNPHPAPYQAFFSRMSAIAKAHGLNLPATIPALIRGAPGAGGNNILHAWNESGKKLGVLPKLIFFIVQDRTADLYKIIKRNCDCRFGLASQVLQSAGVMKCQDQYISNVLLKVNSKLGGINSRALKENGFLTKKSQLNMYRPRHSQDSLMIIGADVSHGPPGSEEHSMASITVSKDPQCCNYMGWVNSNGHREEIIRPSNWVKMFKEPVAHWIDLNKGQTPRRLLYVRDGVSEQQYNQVLDIEVNEIKRLFRELNPKYKIPITVLIASKRHHVRFNPKSQAARDKNGNPVPGVLVETGVTHPFEFDWYMNPHSAIKGTCRPIHYHCIYNENNFTGPELQQLIFEHSFQYARATTPVSLFPAVYYAHLAAKRGEAHMNKPFVSSGKKNAHKGPPGGPPKDKVSESASKRSKSKSPESKKGYIDEPSKSPSDFEKQDPNNPTGLVKGDEASDLMKIQHKYHSWYPFTSWYM
ncbi:Piwi-domain-containing protein [Eremomyces bilateralis CBS 781.70]|uniref:Piwi-domain-containing protein n=1 Tax=Eremomyces bilateralis CBS 781.70 TaxID=1392243 RepID=A0A6G1FT54_9PEZI|nr:Piwi-domain-containing protein [Eremomyces bilateralis CBS 781.70]KAF1808916.1 Piwi-domain-containing protein [Eremomyces bilateralis CBS 781.70]